MNKRRVVAYFPIITIGILFLWWIGTYYLESKTRHTLQELQEREGLITRYQVLQKRWSGKAQKEKRNRFKRWMQIRHVPYNQSRKSGKVVYELKLHHDTADEAIRRIFNLPLRFTKMELKKVDTDDLRLKLEMPE